VVQHQQPAVALPFEHVSHERLKFQTIAAGLGCRNALSLPVTQARLPSARR